MKQSLKDKIDFEMSNIEDAKEALAYLDWHDEEFEGMEDTDQYRTFQKALEMLDDAISELKDIIEED